jgi:hypothetical protein
VANDNERRRREQAERRERDAAAGVGSHHERRFVWLLTLCSGGVYLHCLSGLYSRPRPRAGIQLFAKVIAFAMGMSFQFLNFISCIQVSDHLDSMLGMRLLSCSASFIRRFSWERAPGDGLGLDSWARPPTPYTLRVVGFQTTRLQALLVRLKERRATIMGAIGGPVGPVRTLVCSSTEPFLASLDASGEVMSFV